MRNLNQFPVEILRLIFDELDAKSIANLRLVTRRISDVASEHWLTCQNEVRFFMRKEDLSILSGLLRYPDSCYYKNIKSLICLFNSPGPAEICHGHRRLYQEWVEILGANEDFAVLEKVVKRLPNLEKITVECCHFMDLFRQDGRGGEWWWEEEMESDRERARNYWPCPRGIDSTTARRLVGRAKGRAHKAAKYRCHI